MPFSPKKERTDRHSEKKGGTQRQMNGNIDVDMELRMRDERIAYRKKTRLLLLLVVCLAMAAVIMTVLWRIAEADQSDIAIRAEEEAVTCRDAWSAYRESGKETDRSLALAALYAYSRDMELLTEGSHRESYATVSRELYDRLSGEPALCEASAERMEKLFSQLADSIYHPNAHAELAKLRDALKSGELPETETAKESA